MQQKILEFCLGGFIGVIVLMTFAYMSVAIHNMGPVTVEVQRVAAVEPNLLLTPPSRFDIEQAPIIQMVMPLPAAASELRP